MSFADATFGDHHPRLLFPLQARYKIVWTSLLWQAANLPGAVESLDLGLLVNAQHQSVFRRIHVQDDNISYF